jgi:hypothetical protein
MSTWGENDVAERGLMVILVFWSSEKNRSKYGAFVYTIHIYVYIMYYLIIYIIMTKKTKKPFSPAFPKAPLWSNRHPITTTKRPQDKKSLLLTKIVID